MTEPRCKFCSEPALRSIGAGKLEVRVCARHEAFARDTGKELVHTAARMAGVFFKEKAPLAYEAGRAVFVALRTAQEHNDAKASR